MAHQIHMCKIVGAFIALCVLATTHVPISSAQTTTPTPTPTATPTATNTPTATPTSTSTPRFPYIFRGTVVDANEAARPIPVLDVQVVCTGAPTVTVQTDDGEWEFNEDVHLGPGTLPLTTTCDIELQLPARYQAVRV